MEKFDGCFVCDESSAAVLTDFATLAKLSKPVSRQFKMIGTVGTFSLLRLSTFPFFSKKHEKNFPSSGRCVSCGSWLLCCDKFRIRAGRVAPQCRGHQRIDGKRGHRHTARFRRGTQLEPGQHFRTRKKRIGLRAGHHPAGNAGFLQHSCLRSGRLNSRQCRGSPSSDHVVCVATLPQIAGNVWTGHELCRLGGIDSTNPILAGRSKSANVVVLQVTPTISYQVTDRLSIGVAPVIDLASLNINPMQLGQELGPANEIHNYGTRYAWGGGFQIGTFYDFQNHFKAGFMFKSPIWAERLRISGTTIDGTPREDSFDLNLPMTLSLGFSYDGFKNTVIGMDFRYFDYGNTTGFEEGINSAGKVMGLDWDSVFSVALGIERTLSKKLKVRAGYCWNENPIPSRSAALNVAAPLMMQHTLSFGGTYAVQKDLEFSLAYSHAFKAKITGPFAAEHPVAGTLTGSVTNEAYANLLVAGITKKW